MKRHPISPIGNIKVFFIILRNRNVPYILDQNGVTIGRSCFPPLPLKPTASNAYPTICRLCRAWYHIILGRAALWTFSPTTSCTRTTRRGCRWTDTCLEETAGAAPEPRRHRFLPVPGNKLAPTRHHTLRGTARANPTKAKKNGPTIMCPYCGGSCLRLWLGSRGTL